MMKKVLYIVLVMLIFADLGFSFSQHYNMPLDGDMAESIIPSKECQPIFENPLGIKVITSKQKYHNPNRFFAHWAYHEYFNRIPVFLQKLTNPINSIYLSCAIFKICIQVCLIIFMAMMMSGKLRLFRMEFILAAALIAPLFQINGYRSYMGLIDPSITYTFFYAFPFLLLLIYFLPLFNLVYLKRNQDMHISIKVLWIPLAIVISLSGPLNPGIVVIVSILMLSVKAIRIFNSIEQNKFFNKCLYSLIKIPKYYWYYLVPVSIFCLYSLYIGQFNISNTVHPGSLLEKYVKMAEGLFKMFTQKLGFPALFIVIIINTVIIKKKYNFQEGKKLLSVFKWIGLFALIYLLLLPFGGYREYRPYFVRYDTFIPVTICLMLFYGSTTLFLLSNIKKGSRIWYISIISIVLIIYTISDRGEFDKNDCEKKTLRMISESKEKVINIPYDCTVLSWDKFEKPEDSELNARLLKIWDVTDEKKLYYHSHP